MSDVFNLILGGGLAYGFLCGFIAFGLGYALRSAFRLFSL